MREIKFRGKSITMDKWVIGYLEPGGNTYAIIQCLEKQDNKLEYWSQVAVSLESVGQYTGKKDKNGKEIFEKDIVRYYDNIEDEVKEGEIIWDEERCMFQLKVEDDWLCLAYDWNLQVVGNIHDRKEQRYGED